MNDVSSQDDGRTLRRGLARIAAIQVVTAAIVAIVALVSTVEPARRSSLAGVVVVLTAMLIGYMPLRMLLRAGPEKIVAGWIAAMILRMFATLAGLVLILTRYEIAAKECVWIVCGGYLLLLAIETLGMVRLMRCEFERQQRRQTARPESESEGESGER